MRIHLIASSYPPIWGGVAKAAARCANLMQSRGHSVSITAPAESPDRWVADDDHACWLPEAPFDRMTRLIELNEIIEPHVRRCRPDMLLAYGLLPAGHAAMSIGRRIGIPATVSVRGNDLASYVYSWPEFALETLAGIDHAIFVASSLRDFAARLVPDIQARSTVIINSVDVNLFHPAQDPAGSPGRLIVGTSGVIRWKKGWPIFLEVGRRLTKQFPNLHFRVLGFPWPNQASEIESATVRAGLADRISWTGPLDESQMASELRSLDMYLLCSYREGTPNALLEAMASGLPAVASAADGVQDVITDDVSGFLVPVGDARSMAQRAAELLCHHELRRRMGAAARNRILQNFRREREAAEIEAALLSAVGNRQVRPDTLDPHANAESLISGGRKCPPRATILQ